MFFLVSCFFFFFFGFLVFLQTVFFGFFVFLPLFCFSGDFLSLGPYCLGPFGEDFLFFSRLLEGKS